MKTKTWAVSIAFLLFSGSVALAGQPDGNNWGKWGPDDEHGSLNYITPDKIAMAARLAKKGKVFNLAIDLKPNTPGWTGRTYRHTFDFIFNPTGDGVGAADDAIAMHQQYSTQWDGFGHFFFNRAGMWNKVSFGGPYVWEIDMFCLARTTGTPRSMDIKKSRP